MPGGFGDEKPAVPLSTKPTLAQPLPPAPSPSARDSTATLVSDTPKDESNALVPSSARPQSGLMNWSKDLKRRFSKGDGLPALPAGSPAAGAGLLPSSGAGPSQPSGHVTPLTNISMTLYDLTAIIC
jgi:hypothetical protein